MKQRIESISGSTVLYDVPKVEYGAYHGCTPYPICLKACANYLGQEMDYDAAMAGSGAGFRLTWDKTAWNAGNVDVIFAYDDPVRIYAKGVAFLGRKFNFLGRKPGVSKEDFINFIRNEIDEGHPCIALGIIGPPETCVITGYRDSGETLLGWNVFQDNPEFGASVTFDDSGYFVTRSWWENPETLGLISMGDQTEEEFDLEAFLGNAIEVLTGRECGRYAKGLLAYDFWKKSVEDDSQFSANAIMSLLVERLMCQGDAMDTLIDGRSNVSSYLKKLAEKYPENRKPLNAAAGYFNQVAEKVGQMARILGGWQRGEQQMKAFTRPEIRREIGSLISACKEADKAALEILIFVHQQIKH